jgi:polyketide cyclase/dehydrase/lipid transport protein
MARVARAATVVPLAPEGALALWTSVERWPTFVEGFARTLELSDDWPAEGARAVWESGPGGRGRVTEKVLEHGTGRFATRVHEEALHGRQAMSVSEDADGTRVELTLEYELAKYGPLRALADVIFIRRALRDALRRTLRRYAVEAEEEAGLR